MSAERHNSNKSCKSWRSYSNGTWFDDKRERYKDGRTD